MRWLALLVLLPALFYPSPEPFCLVALLFIAAMAVGVVVFIVFMERAQRRLLIQYPKRQEGNRMAGGERSFLPLKVKEIGDVGSPHLSAYLQQGKKDFVRVAPGTWDLSPKHKKA